MAEEHKKTVVNSEGEQVEVSDRGLFDFMGKKEEEKSQEEVLVTGVENVHIDEGEKIEEKKEEEKKEGLLEKLQRSHSSSSSSSSDEEEVVPDGEKKKKKKGLKEKIKEKLSGGDKKEESETSAVVPGQADVVVAPAAPVPAAPAEDTNVVVEKIDESVKVEEEKKGFLDKIKEKLPGYHKKEGTTADHQEDQAGVKQETVSESTTAEEGHQGQDGKEKKGILGKIMEKLPGYHKEETDKNTPPAGH